MGCRAGEPGAAGARDGRTEGVGEQHSDRIVEHDPLVRVIDGFASPAECAAIVAAAEAVLGPPMVSGEELGEDRSVRTGGLAWMMHDHDEVIARVCGRVAELVGRSLDFAEQLQVVRYHPGERYLAHFDSYDRATRVGWRCTRRGGQRLVTALLYLRAPAAGGATRFPRLDLDVEASPGRLLLFHNTGEDWTKPHPLSLHSGEPVEQGEKWIANLWFRERAWRGPDAWTEDEEPPSR